MDFLKKGWFSDVFDLCSGTCLSYEIDAVLHSEKTEYQEIMILQTKHHGRTLILDNIIQLMESDEFSYNEMVTFLPLCSHPNPRKVLIIGGGSGGAARQVMKHPTVEEVDVVEIDGKLSELCKKFLSSAATVYGDPRVSLFIEDGMKYLKRTKKKYDVIITDASDPVGPSTHLYRTDYFTLKKNALAPGGIVSMQAGSMWVYPNKSQEFDICTFTIKGLEEVFGKSAYAYVSVPCFPSGQIGIVVATADPTIELKKPFLELSDKFLKEKDIRYYSPSVHVASFVIPRYFAELIGAK